MYVSMAMKLTLNNISMAPKTNLTATNVFKKKCKEKVKSQKYWTQRKIQAESP